MISPVQYSFNDLKRTVLIEVRVCVCVRGTFTRVCVHVHKYTCIFIVVEFFFCSLLSRLSFFPNLLFFLRLVSVIRSRFKLDATIWGDYKSKTKTHSDPECKILFFFQFIIHHLVCIFCCCFVIINEFGIRSNWKLQAIQYIHTHTLVSEREGANAKHRNANERAKKHRVTQSNGLTVTWRKTNEERENEKTNQM